MAKPISLDALKDHVKSVTDEEWTEFLAFVREEERRRKEQIRQHVKSEVEELARKYGLTVQDLYPVARQTRGKKEPEPTISLSVLRNLKKAAPDGLYNPKAPEGQQWFRRAGTDGKWPSIGSYPWLRRELQDLSSHNDRVPGSQIEALAKRYAPR